MKVILGKKSLMCIPLILLLVMQCSITKSLSWSLANLECNQTLQRHLMRKKYTHETGLQTGLQTNNCQFNQKKLQMNDTSSFFYINSH